MSSNFDKVIDSFVSKASKNLLNVARNAIRDVVVQAQTPLAKGGKMHVDTGFLRWSGTASLAGMPYGETVGRDRRKGEVGVLAEYKYDENNGGRMLNTVLADLKLGDVFSFGWTARYAEIREVYDGFMISATANFKSYVDKEARRLSK